MTGKYEPADLGQLSGYMAIAKHVLNTPVLAHARIPSHLQGPRLSRPN
ncbi:MAG: hypothetical protein IJL17_06765 [Kiritimatiellae bacterium]|nr:hypothetical protein [Kiritimatiellia bacterium]